MSEHIRVVLPQKYDLVVGDTFQLFYRGVVEAPNPYCYDILSVCEKGRNFPRYFEFLPEEPGEYDLTIFVCGPDKKVLGQATTVLKVAEPEAPKKPLHILCIGDSLTGGSSEGRWPAEAYRRLTAIGGEPAGLGFSDISFVGTCKRDSVGYEGYGGWTWISFYTSGWNAIWISCTHDKLPVDQHSCWQDENGNVWVLETIQKETLKFRRFDPYDCSALPLPEAGTQMTHFGYGTNIAPIEVKACWEEAASPFIDPATGAVDIRSYCKRNRIEKIDAVYIMLGCNGWMKTYREGLGIEAYCQKNVTEGKELVEHIHQAFPHAKVKIMGLPGCSVNGGTGTSYGAQMPYCDDYGQCRLVMEMNLAYEAWTKEPGYCEYMEFINISGQFDAEFMMPAEDKPVNIRSKQTERIGINGNHPLPEGYMQIADAAFRNMVHLCKEQ